MEKLKMHTPDFTDQNIARIAELFPDCVTESRDESGKLKRAIDFDQLKQHLAGNIVEGPQERYHLNWPGKREALLTANAPIAKTLRPCRDESVDFDTTKNLFIEGDNLDALKLLQETYLGKVKMIYIDPPYNTGKDFIYKDDFVEDVESYFLNSNQKDEQGHRLFANNESNGRFHSAWLTMMYSRMKLARSLLADDGVLFVSLDEGEIENLKLVLNEIFGANNLVTVFSWVRTRTPAALSQKTKTVVEFILCYERTKTNRPLLGIEKPAQSANTLLNQPNAVSVLNFPPGVIRAGFDDCTVKKGEYGSDSYSVSLLDDVQVRDGVFISAFRLRARFRWSQSYLESQLGSGVTVRIASKRMLPGYEKGSYGREALPNLIDDKVGVGTNENASKEVEALLGEEVVSYPKPVSLLRYLISSCTSDGDIVLDFFAGSSTTAHAVLAENEKDKVARSFVMVQLPEELDLDEKKQTAAASFCDKLKVPRTIAEIGKERIRRAGQKIKKEAGLNGQNLDIGFRVLKVDTSNMEDVYYSPDAVAQDLLSDQVSNIKQDRTPEDLLFQVLLDWGVDLTLPINKETIGGKTVFLVDTNALAACFDEGISEELVKELADRKPLRVVFRDAGFTSDSVKINVEQIFKLKSPGTEVRSI
ncbi:MAG: site-specific DNA-methyltransferase [Acidobacteria bacterium]|nr:site-specific DNA-methyltransferase [Acidobacteriota bacterium]